MGLEQASGYGIGDVRCQQWIPAMGTAQLEAARWRLGNVMKAHSVEQAVSEKDTKDVIRLSLN